MKIFAKNNVEGHTNLTFGKKYESGDFLFNDPMTGFVIDYITFQDDTGKLKLLQLKEMSDFFFTEQEYRKFKLKNINEHNK